MSIWDSYPAHYRSQEIQTILKAVCSGDSAAVIGLSGSGKSNLFGFLANRSSTPRVKLLLVDCNRLSETSPVCLYAFMRATLNNRKPAADEAIAFETEVDNYFQEHDDTLCFLLDRFDLFLAPRQDGLYNNLRALRDLHKYRLTYVIGARSAVPLDTELSELFSGRTLWLGPLSEEDARWSISRHAQRMGFDLPEAKIMQILSLTGGYPSLLKAACEALANGADSEQAIQMHTAVQLRLNEFWEAKPEEAELEASRLLSIPLIQSTRPASITSTRLTAKEQLLLDYFQEHANQVCDKDDLIRAVWPEDHVFSQGVRDDSLAQLVKRLRRKIEPVPANPRLIITIPGRGYEYAGVTFIQNER
jgi:hypothetical protein